jgi:hypothetical protein
MKMVAGAGIGRLKLLDRVKYGLVEMEGVEGEGGPAGQLSVFWGRPIELPRK